MSEGTDLIHRYTDAAALHSGVPIGVSAIARTSLSRSSRRIVSPCHSQG
jgi:hypothetical protein